MSFIEWHSIQLALTSIQFCKWTSGLLRNSFMSYQHLIFVSVNFLIDKTVPTPSLPNHFCLLKAPSQSLSCLAELADQRKVGEMNRSTRIDCWITRSFAHLLVCSFSRSLICSATHLLVRLVYSPIGSEHLFLLVQSYIAQPFPLVPSILRFERVQLSLSRSSARSRLPSLALRNDAE